MGENGQVLETSSEEASEFVWKDITRVNKAGSNMKWERVHVDTIDKWRNKMIELESLHCYATVQSFANVVHIEGEEYITPLYFDFDSDDSLEESLMDVRKLKDYFCIGLGIEERGTEEGVRFFFSGNRGFHVTVEPELCGITPSVDLVKVIRHIVEALAAPLELKTLDRAVYSKRRMWRMVNTQHGKSKLWKIRLTPAEIGGLSVEDIKNLAASPRSIEFGDE